MRRMLTGLVAVLLVVPAAGGWAAEPEPSPPDPIAELAALVEELAELLAGVEVDEETAAQAASLLGDVLGAVQFATVTTELVQSTPETDTVAPTHGEVVSTVARCAPRGRDVATVFRGMRNHGAFVTAAAHGDTVEVEVPTIEEVDGVPTVTGTQTVSFDLSTVEGAEGLCAATEVIAEAEALRRQAAGEDPGPGQRPDWAGVRDRDERAALRAEAGRPAGGPPDRTPPDHARGKGGGRGTDHDDTTE